MGAGHDHTAGARGNERALSTALGLREVGRRPLASEEVELALEGETFALRPAGWATPYAETSGSVLARTASGEPLALCLSAGRGRIVALGSFFGKAYTERRYTDFERLVSALGRLAGIRPALRVSSQCPLNWAQQQPTNERGTRHG